MKKNGTHNLDTTKDAIRACYTEPGLFTLRKIRSACPQTPKGTVSASISQLADAGYLVVHGRLSELRNLTVYSVAPKWAIHPVSKAVEIGAEVINRAARQRFEKAGLR